MMLCRITRQRNSHAMVEAGWMAGLNLPNR